MDKNRVEGTKHQVKGTLKEVAGKLTGNRTKVLEGKAQKNLGKAQKAWARPPTRCAIPAASPDRTRCKAPASGWSLPVRHRNQAGGAGRAAFSLRVRVGRVRPRSSSVSR
jgi:uncharacterized protein YjbJ (UPF0337 family)